MTYSNPEQFDLYLQTLGAALVLVEEEVSNKNGTANAIPQLSAVLTVAANLVTVIRSEAESQEAGDMVEWMSAVESQVQVLRGVYTNKNFKSFSHQN